MEQKRWLENLPDVQITLFAVCLLAALYGVNRWMDQTAQKSEASAATLERAAPKQHSTAHRRDLAGQAPR